jgi:hypothetical protein
MNVFAAASIYTSEDIPYLITPAEVQKWDNVSQTEPTRIVDTLNLVAANLWNDHTTLVRDWNL